MKFNRLRISNIGAFYGNYDFDLKTISPRQNIILIGGKNGSGKTTILESIRLALFGPLSFGYKTESSPYFDKISSKLNNAAKKNKETKYQIILDFEMVESLKRNTYTLRRSWQPTKSSIKEELEIQRNLRQLSTQEKDIFMTKLREETPPQLLEFCLFDGERIAQIISDETLSEYLKETAKVMFNIDLFESLESDLQTYVKQESVSGRLDDDEKQLLDIEESKNKLVHIRQVSLNENEQLEQQIDTFKAELVSLNRSYETHGGLLKEQRETFLQEMNTIDQQRGTMMEKNRGIVSSVLPFAMVRDQLQNVSIQMEREAKFEIATNIRNVSSEDSFTQILRDLQLKGKIKLIDSDDIISKGLFEGFLQFISPEIGDSIHRASSQQRAEFTNLFNDVLSLDIEEIRNNFLENTALIERVKEIRTLVSNNDSTSELKELLEKMNRVNNSLATLLHRKEQLIVSLSLLNEQITDVDKKYEDQKIKLVKSRKTENVFTIANRVMDVSRMFRSLQLKKKLQQVEIEAAKMLQMLYRKELFVVRVFIHPETFIMKLYNSTNEEINKESLSAGEKQILLLSTIWAMAMCSKRRLPFVFDTLLGRLDQTHKKSIIEHFLPQCGEQVMILSTDSEIDKEHFKLIQPSVAKVYTIDYNANKDTVDATSDYFTFQSEEVITNELSS